MSESPIVQFDDVSFSYNAIPTVRNVSFSISVGEFVGLVGPNGSGKTTLLHLLMGILPPDSGSIEVFTEPVHEFDDGKRIAYIPQVSSGKERTMPITVREVVSMGRFTGSLLGRFDSSDHQQVDHAIEAVGLQDKAATRLHHLSGGERQRVSIARTLASDADLLVLDEPTAGIDADSLETFYSLLHDLNDDGITIIMVEHDLQRLAQHVDRLLRLEANVGQDGFSVSSTTSDQLSIPVSDPRVSSIAR